MSVHTHSVAVMSRSMSPTTSRAPQWSVQPSLDQAGRQLRGITFCVVDLETTGGSARGGDRITEIGAVKVRGGVVLGEFQTLVNPGAPIPAFIAVLTGITNALVAAAPTIESALPAFLDFAAGSVLVAHNAPFDVGFLRHFAQAQGRAWPSFEVIDTARLARRVLTRDDAPNCRLASLAKLFHSTTTPNHRALADARATVDVLHGLMERLGNLGVHSLEELADFTSQVSESQRRKRHLAEPLPHEPGVYLFRDSNGEVLYVGTSKDLRTRVRSYFTAAETRSRMGEMIGLAESVDPIVCATPLEAAVRELRLIAAHRPRYNRRSKYPDKITYIRLTDEPWPRLSIVRRATPTTPALLGPFGSRQTAERALAAMHETFMIRQCTIRLPRHPRDGGCVLGEMGRCMAPCSGSVDPRQYAAEVDRVKGAIESDAESVLMRLNQRMERLGAEERFEEAATCRDRLLAFLRGAHRGQRLRPVLSNPQMVAARRVAGSWEVHVVRFGRLAAAGVIPPRADAHAYVAALLDSADSVTPIEPSTSVAETEEILGWLETPGTRLIEIAEPWTSPLPGAGRLLRSLPLPSSTRSAPRSLGLGRVQRLV